MSNIHDIAEALRKEPFHPFSLRYNCIGRSFRFKKACRQIGIDARAVISLGFVRNKRFKLLPPIMLSFHGWVEVKGRRIMLVRSPTGLNPWGTAESDEKPIIAIWI